MFVGYINKYILEPVNQIIVCITYILLDYLYYGIVVSYYYYKMVSDFESRVILTRFRGKMLRSIFICTLTAYCK